MKKKNGEEDEWREKKMRPGVSDGGYHLGLSPPAAARWSYLSLTSHGTRNGYAQLLTVHHTIGNVLCCKCGISMQPNAVNMCANCLRSEIDITEGLQKHVIICHCPECDSYLQPPRTWIKAQLESKELLTFSVKRLKNLNKI
ncbi:60S ribosomal export protein NMD3 [Capsicum chinense]|nr:60S ribosomal export protein NMD3 [Capsicum chinense]